jgi:putative redox protein
MKSVAHATLTSQSGYAQTVRVRQHRLTADEPETAGGTDTGPAPYELILAGLGACTAITLRMYADRKGWDLGELSVDLRLFKDDAGPATIEREVRASAALTEEQRARLAEIAEKTPVTRTLKAGAAIQTRFA